MHGLTREHAQIRQPRARGPALAEPRADQRHERLGAQALHRGDHVVEGRHVPRHAGDRAAVVACPRVRDPRPRFACRQPVEQRPHRARPPRGERRRRPVERRHQPRHRELSVHRQEHEIREQQPDHRVPEQPLGGDHAAPRRLDPRRHGHLDVRVSVARGVAGSRARHRHPRQRQRPRDRLDQRRIRWPGAPHLLRDPTARAVQRQPVRPHRRRLRGDQHRVGAGQIALLLAQHGRAQHCVHAARAPRDQRVDQLERLVERALPLVLARGEHQPLRHRAAQVEPPRRPHGPGQHTQRGRHRQLLPVVDQRLPGVPCLAGG